MSGYYSVEGCIGSGKTTVAELVAKLLRYSFVGEAAATNPFLNKFYTSPARYAFETELTFALIHYHQLRDATLPELVTDFTLGKDLVFARLNLEATELRLFEELHTLLMSRVPLPRVVFFLRLPIDACLERIKQRNIESETNITRDYLSRLESRYLELLPLCGERTEIVDTDPTASPQDVAQHIIARLKVSAV